MQTYADSIVQCLAAFGCHKAFGVSGANIHHIWKALHRPDITVYHFGHESGAAFAAAEYSIQADKIATVFVTSGPGITNAITGLRCARTDGACIVFIAGLTSEETDRTGRRLLQETFPNDVETLTGPTVDSALSYCVIIRDESDVKRLKETLVRIKRDPRGGVLGVFLTDAKSKSLMSQQHPNFQLCPYPTLSKEALDVCKEVVGMLKTKRSVLWIGYGCRRASALVRQLAERYTLPVLATPRAKGIFPETHPLYQGTTGLGASLNPTMRTNPPKGVLLLGSKAAELSSRFIQEEWIVTDFYCVSLETSEVKRNMPEGSVFIQAEISLFLGAVMKVEDTEHRNAYRHLPDAIIPPVLAASKGRIHPATVMSVVQDVVINQFGCSIIADAGNSLCWTAHYLKFPKHGLYRSNLDSSPLGHAVCGVVGMGLANNHAVAIVSDAAMLKHSEVSTAVLYGSKAIWLVMNSSQFGTSDQLTRTWGDVPPPYCIPYSNFELLARAVSCHGSTVTEENGLRKALREALVRDGPTVINVLVDSPPMAPLEP
ncbi:acetolactate synthase [Fusarium phyllophilum]|uniref:Acetolactate synthase n=1 Tax=Fusarium phyllophilum TaxID=47803 RepID=A0A8H5KCD7_9HYPO|nr:acetolactate synthase [Fusarium phyllophilum]